MSIHRFSHKQDPNPKKLPTACVIRYGAIGDTVQAISLLKVLKEEGYHVTFMCAWPGSQLAETDPHIDRLIVQTQNQVPMGELGHLWLWFEHRGAYGKKFDKWVNLTESVENNLLALPGNVKFAWAPLVRHKAMNFNYLEWQHGLAEIPFRPSYKFYPLPEEIKWRDQELAKMAKRGIKKRIFWALAGSSRTHKIYPHMQEIWRHVLHHYPEWGIVTIGDDSTKPMEVGFHGESRMWLASGCYNLRQTATLLESADVVVGPETGLMSMAAFYPMPKICILSHSTIENLTRDWVNTTSMWAPKTECPGRGKNLVLACHKMLPNFEGCRQNEKTLVAQCMTEVKPEWVWEAIQTCMRTGEAPKWTPPAD